jgi:hypothetical protein
VDAAPHNQYSVAIYSDNNGAPGALLAQSSTGTLAANSWNTLPISATLQANTAYWLVYNANGSNTSVDDLRYNGDSSTVGAYLDHAFGSWPSNLNGAIRGNWRFSIYATVH